MPFIAHKLYKLFHLSYYLEVVSNRKFANSELPLPEDIIVIQRKSFEEIPLLSLEGWSLPLDLLQIPLHTISHSVKLTNHMGLNWSPDAYIVDIHFSETERMAAPKINSDERYFIISGGSIKIFLSTYQKLRSCIWNKQIQRD